MLLKFLDEPHATWPFSQNVYKFPILSMYIQLYIQVFMDQGSFILLCGKYAYTKKLVYFQPSSNWVKIKNKTHPPAPIFSKNWMRIYLFIWYGLTTVQVLYSLEIWCLGWVFIILYDDV